jgi:acyl-CoA synthetase (AMP-forming)/AMP-acid ligase II
VRGEDVLAEPGAGLLVGSPVKEVEVDIVNLPSRIDAPVEPGFIESRRVPVGEVVVRGANVSATYVGDPDAAALTKVRQRDGTVWHRTGDTARRDDQGRLWLLGRVGEAVEWNGRRVHPLALEAELSGIPGITRAALVNASDGPVLALMRDERTDLAPVHERLQALGLDEIPLRLVDEIPVDARHQSKVDRAALVRQLA